MGTVYRGLDPLIGRAVAIKTVRLAEVADSSEHALLRERLYREAQSAGSLSHPGIVTIYHIGEENGVTYIAMEFIDGPALGGLLASGTRPPPEWVAGVLRQAAAALDFAHQRGVVHRDIKPANVMLTSDGRVKVADFGVARIASSTLTRTGMSMGSPSYMSPEQVQGTAVDGRSDQYSLAVTACELLSGQRPFVADTLTALAYRIVYEEPQLDALAAAAGSAATAVLRKALSKDPDGRYGSCSEFVEALAAALERRAVAAPPPASRGLPSWALGGAAAIVLVAAGSAGVILWKDSRGAGGSAPEPEVLAAAAASEKAPPAPPRAAPRASSRPAAEPVPATARPAAAAVPAVTPSRAPAPPPPKEQAVSAPAPKPEPPRTEPPASAPRVQETAPEPALSQPPVSQPPVSQPPASRPVLDPGPASQPPAPVRPERTPPALLFQVPPEYTEEARRAGLQGEVLLSVEVDERGSPASIQIVRSLDAGLDQKAVEAVGKWRFRPAMNGTQAVRAVVQVAVKFQLANAPARRDPSLKRPPSLRD